MFTGPPKSKAVVAESTRAYANCPAAPAASRSALIWRFIHPPTGVITNTITNIQKSEESKGIRNVDLNASQFFGKLILLFKYFTKYPIIIAIINAPKNPEGTGVILSRTPSTIPIVATGLFAT